ncbi:hypothetical protein MNBD_UNCLBAC01-703 [hydrothermal vent metagenome]|uniref:Sirohydrochlorin cobaltochelatase n=1 Tax=hydrothermal vent metagenome TaxID=652676 RepID=A0A3B1D2K4_9ZZZZ
MKSILIVSHGSYSPKLKDELKWLIHLLKQKSVIPIFHYAFLEIQEPTILNGIDQCIKDGATEVVVLLNFLNSGKHVDDDIPKIVYQAQLKHPAIKFQISRPVGQHKQIADLFINMIN